jgi:hypothetical protein
MPREFHSDFDKKLMGGNALRWIQENGSSIIAAPAWRQSSNGLVERTWQTMVCMARSYFTGKQVGREFWFFADKHAAHMLNQVPGRLRCKLTSPFELVYNQKRTWFELFSIGYFPVKSKAGEATSASQSHCLDGIAVGRDDQTYFTTHLPKSTTLLQSLNWSNLTFLPCYTLRTSDMMEASYVALFATVRTQSLSHSLPALGCNSIKRTGQ